jgi:hypothetical protein
MPGRDAYLDGLLGEHLPTFLQEHVAYWHLAAFQTQAPNGRYRTNNGQRPILALDC